MSSPKAPAAGPAPRQRTTSPGHGTVTAGTGLSRPAAAPASVVSSPGQGTVAGPSNVQTESAPLALGGTGFAIEAEADVSILLPFYCNLILCTEPLYGMPNRELAPHKLFSIALNIG